MIRLSVADPSFATPAVVKNALSDALEKGLTHYCGTRGLDFLRKSISESYLTRYGFEVDPTTQIIPTNGAGEGLYLILQAITKDGDEIIIPDPTYHGFIHKLHHFGAKPIFVPLRARSDFRLDIDAINSEVRERTKAIFLCNPNNPTGIVYGRDELQQVGDILRENRHVLLILDECYSRILYDGVKYYHLLQDESLRDQILVVNSFSKTYAMTGWRLGYVIANQSHIDRIASVAFDIRSSTNTAVQYAGAVALRSNPRDLELMVNEYRARRNLMMDCLKGMNLSFPIPQGGFEIFANFRKYESSSSVLKTKLAQDAYVETVAGSEFGPHGEGYLRLVFCVDRDKLIEGMDRIRYFLEDKNDSQNEHF